MLELKKLRRAIWRDHLDNLALGAAGVVCVASLGVGMAIGFSTAVFFGMMGAMVVGATASLIPVAMRNFSKAYAEAEKTLQGPAQKVRVLVNTQKLLSQRLYKYPKDAPLPSDALKGFEPYLNDAREAAREVKRVDPETTIEQPTFAFQRARFNTKALRWYYEPVVEIPLLHAPPPWEVERQRRAALDAEIDKMSDGATRDIKVSKLRLKTPAAA